MILFWYFSTFRYLFTTSPSCDFSSKTFTFCFLKSSKDQDKVILSKNYFQNFLIFTGAYMYIETTGRKPGDKAWLVSSTLQAKSDECLKFHYFMKGTDIGQLNVNLRQNGTNNITRLWNLAGSRKDKWVEASVPLKFDKPSEVRLTEIEY